MNLKRKKGKLIAGAIVLILFVYLFFFSPPIMISKGGIELGYYDENFENPYAHLGEKYLSSGDPDRHSTGDFKHFYFLNFRFWEDLEIQQAEYVGAEKAAEVKRILPFLYSAEQNLDGSYHNAFGVKRGNKGWYFDYYVSI